MITENCNSKIFFNFSYCFLFTHICLHFFSYSGEGIFILYKESEENREIRNVRLVGNTGDSSILLIQVRVNHVDQYLRTLLQYLIKFGTTGTIYVIYVATKLEVCKILYIH